ncbi:MAG: 1-carboxybiuret hydrolase subunit AtzG-like [Betaproteobacteria bacterium]|jgi:hypothetical protein|nr:1-carboxybiuret hydrolase subunit AtzG-like [Betaproteobacteria bacterium]
MKRLDVENFVIAAARAQGLDLDAEQLQRVGAVFARNAELAELMLELDLPESIEPAPVFEP